MIIIETVAACARRLARTTMRRTIPYSTSTATAAPSRLANDNGKRRGASGAPGTAAITKTKPQTKRPSLYRVLLLNDD
jgi:ATP-dependent Clp protease adaptor protein ClpS